MGFSGTAWFRWQKSKGRVLQRLYFSCHAGKIPAQITSRSELACDLLEIISDHLGTPVETYDENGNRVWERELDIYGRVKTGRNETGEKTFIPFR